MLNFDFYIFLAISVLNCTLGFLVYIHSPREKINRAFFLFVITLLSWMVSNYIETVVRDIEIARFFIYFDFASAAILAYTFSLFCFYFTGSEWPKKPELFFIPTFLFAAVSVMKSFIVVDPRFDYAGRLIYDLGPFYWFYAAYLFVYFGAGVYHLIAVSLKRHNEDKNKVILVLLGLGLSAAIALTMNLFFQNVVSVEVFHIGIYSMIFVVFFVAYAIIRHKIFNMRIFAAETLTVFIIVISIAQIFGSRSVFELLGRLLFFVVILVFGLALIRSVLSEINRRQEMERLKKELEIAYGKLKVIDEAKTDFLSMASHQLRSPLTVVRLGIGALLDGTFGDLTDQRQNDALNKMLESSTRLINLIGEYLNVSRIELGKMKYNFKEQDLCQLVKEIAEEYIPRAKAKNLELNFEKKGAVHNVKFDEEKIRHVIVNLIDNAIKYTNQGSIKVICEQLEKDVKVSVKDTGFGIKKDEMPVLFQKFRRVGSGTRRRRDAEPVEGSGLGLHVAKMFVDKHGGKIWVESPGVGKGSTFAFSLSLNGPPKLDPDEQGEGGKGVEMPRY